MKKMLEKCSTSVQLIRVAFGKEILLTKCTSVRWRGLDSPLIKTLERENLILMTKMLKKCSTDQRFIRKRNATYKLGTLAELFS